MPPCHLTSRTPQRKRRRRHFEKHNSFYFVSSLLFSFFSLHSYFYLFPTLQLASPTHQTKTNQQVQHRANCREIHESPADARASSPHFYLMQCRSSFFSRIPPSGAKESPPTDRFIFFSRRFWTQWPPPRIRLLPPLPRLHLLLPPPTLFPHPITCPFKTFS